MAGILRTLTLLYDAAKLATKAAGYATTVFTLFSTAAAIITPLISVLWPLWSLLAVGTLVRAAAGTDSQVAAAALCGRTRPDARAVVLARVLVPAMRVFCARVLRADCTRITTRREATWLFAH